MTGQTPKISVVIPSYNKVRFVTGTLDSIFSQKYTNLEVIIQDGGSTDGTLEIIRKYAKKYPAVIKWESKKDKGQLDAVNKGMQKATGEILSFINADDEYKPGAFASVADAYIKNPAALWFAGRGVMIDEKDIEIAKPITRYKNLLLGINNYSQLLMTNYLMQPSVFFTRSSFEKYGPFSGTEDFITEYELWLKLGKKGMPVIINIILSEFRIEPTTKTKRLFKDLLNEDAKIVRKYTGNPFILGLHDLNNLGRVIIGKFV